MRLLGAPTPLPEPRTERWQPLRLGLVNLFYYDYQELWFRDGRLLLRGNNGTGKSKVLALTLPFLLDGDMSPSRVEPDGDPAKRMEWNLLLGGAHEERLGYSWLELGRVSDAGETTYLCIGCGLKAAAGRGIADRWLFVTSQRIGKDLFLIGSDQTALTRDRLVEAIGPSGSVTQRVEQHRRNLDERLFHLGPERYAALMQLLIQLRQPQLSKRPSEERLSAALCEALPPVDATVLSDIASAFHDLEQQRDELAAFRDTRDHVEQFLKRYRVYAQIAARRQAGELRSAHSAYEERGRELAHAALEIREAGDEKGQVETRRSSVAGELREQRAAREELRSSAELEKIATAKRHLDEAHRIAARDRARRDRQEAARNARRESRDRVAAEAVQTRAAVSSARDEAERVAGEAGVGSEHATLLAALELPDGADRQGVDAAGTAARGVAARRRDAAEHVRVHVRTAIQARARAGDVRHMLQEREAERDAAADRREEARCQVDEQGRALTSAWTTYASGLVELRLPDPDTWIPELSAWTETLDGENPARAVLHRAAAEHERSLAQTAARAGAERDDLRRQRTELETERARLEAGETSHPPAPHTRGNRVREGRPGAPLWQVTDFAGDLGAEDRARLEAALEAAGLLDAWITPDGSLLDPETFDVVLRPGEPVASSLASVLGVAIDVADPQAAAVAAGTVEVVLAGIGYGEQPRAEAWVDVRGRFKVGPLEGAWSKPAAEYIGRGAREEARRRRLEALRTEITATEVALRSAEDALAAIESRQRTLAAERDRAPADDALRQSHSELASAIRDLETRQAAMDAQEPIVARAQDAALRAEGERDETAADLRVPATEPELDALIGRTSDYRASIERLLSGVRSHIDKRAALEQAEQELERAERDVHEATQETLATEHAEQEARSRYQTLQETLCATLDQIRQRLQETDARIEHLESEEGTLSERHDGLVARLARAQERQAQLEERQREAVLRRDAAVSDLRRFASTGLLALAVPDVEPPAPEDAWAAEPAVRVARRVEQTLFGVGHDDAAWRRIREELSRRHTELGEALTRHGHHAQLDPGDWIVVTIQFGGQECRPDALAQQLADEIDYRERILTAKERELLEEHLIGDVASHLQERISEAETQVAQMNHELAERPTSTGMRLRLRWEPRPDAPAGLREARARLLRQQSDLWSPEDRAAVGDFLHRQIETERAENEHGTWQEHLRRALDYRGWHRFTIERYQDGRWRSATGPASGGERVLTASLPLFAAAAAHYRSAHVHAPRLVLLDEAFAGVDDDARAKCLGLLASFDLDVVMTSEREWGFYTTVPGIATHQLARREGIDAVHVTTWEWDGRVRERIERVYAPDARSADDVCAHSGAEPGDAGPGSRR